MARQNSSQKLPYASPALALHSVGMKIAKSWPSATTRAQMVSRASRLRSSLGPSSTCYKGTITRFKWQVAATQGHAAETIDQLQIPAACLQDVQLAGLGVVCMVHQEKSVMMAPPARLFGTARGGPTFMRGCRTVLLNPARCIRGSKRFMLRSTDLFTSKGVLAAISKGKKTFQPLSPKHY